MSKHTLAFLVPVLLVLLAGCRSEGTTQPAPTHYWTALKAYERMKPAMLAWHVDAVAIKVGSISRGDSPEWRIQAGGRAREWSFMVISLDALKGTQVYVRDEAVIVGIDGIRGKEGPISKPKPGAQLPFTLENVVIDSDEAVQIALQKGGVKPDDVLLRVYITQLNSRSSESVPSSWELLYGSQYDLHDVSYRKVIFIDVVTGEVLWSDFTR